MITVYVLVFEDGSVESAAFRNENEAWREAVRLGRDRNASPDQWTIHAVEVEI